ncbi:MAG: hypoxanthine phosphoribosyltransferase [Woeseiaceae bacterium]
MSEKNVSQKTPEVLISEAEIEARVRELAKEISSNYEECGEVVLVGVLKGSFIFLADLARRLTIPRVIEFIAVSSYGSSSRSSGAVRLVMDVRGNILGKHVIIVEDIVDTGHTLKYLIGMLDSHGPASIKTCALVRKAERAEVDVEVDYLGFDIPDKWVVGYGLDYAEQHRTLPYIGIISPTD